MNTCSRQRSEKKQAAWPVSGFEKRMRSLVRSSFEEFKNSSWKHRRIMYRWLPSSKCHPHPAISFWAAQVTVIETSFPVFSPRKKRGRWKPARPRSTMVAPERKAIGYFGKKLQKSLGIRLESVPNKGKDLLIFSVVPREDRS